MTTPTPPEGEPTAGPVPAPMPPAGPVPASAPPAYPTAYPPAPGAPAGYPPAAGYPAGYPASAPPYPPPGYAPGYPASGPPAPAMGYPSGGYQVVPPPGYAPPTTRPTSPGGAPLAEFADRLVAFIIDGAILGVINLAVIGPVYFFAIFAILPTTVQVNGDPYVNPTAAEVGSFVLAFFGLFAFIMLFMITVSYLYEVELALRNQGQTVGKRVMKIRIVPVDPTTTLTRSDLFRRFLAQRIAGIFIPVYSWVDGLWQLWDQPYRQCLHDKFAKTLVIKIGP